eukprot:gene10993-biopygen6335
MEFLFREREFRTTSSALLPLPAGRGGTQPRPPCGGMACPRRKEPWPRRGWEDGWRGARRGGGADFRDFRGGFRRANPLLAPRACHPARGLGARTGRMGAEVGPVFQRLSRDTLCIPGVRSAQTMSRHVIPKETRECGFFWSWDHVQNPRFAHVFFCLLSFSWGLPRTFCFRGAMRAAERARSGRANDTDGIREWSSFPTTVLGTP